MRLLIVALLSFRAAVLQSQQPTQVDTAARHRAMDKLSFLIGDWGGEATVSTGPGGSPLFMWQTEWVRPKLKGQVLAVEGVGRRLIVPGGVPGDTVFNAWAVIDWSPERGYVMRSATLDGRSGEFPVEVSDSGFVWGFAFPAGRVRYTMRLTPAGKWHERGEFTRDGTRWFPTIEMRLTRNAAPPRR